MNDRPTDRCWSRREVLATGGLAVGAGLALGSGRAHAQDAKPEAIKPSDNPGVYAFEVGEFRAWSISDGYAAAPGIKPMWAPEASEEQVRAVLREERLREDAMEFHFNVLLLERGGERILIDSGNGVGGRPSTGRLVERLAGIGVTPASITRVVISHLHRDHFGGLLDADGGRVFPNAGVVMSVVEKEFWERATPTDLKSEALPAEWKQGMTQGAKAQLDAMKGWMEAIPAGSEVLAGLSLVELPGHTPGHSGVRVSSQGQELLHIADLAHSAALMFRRPAWTIAFDTDPAGAAATRGRTLGEAAEGRARLFGYHVPWPGLGHVRREGEGYRWVPEPWRW